MPAERYRALFSALLDRHRRWDADALRFAALGLAQLPVEADALADDVFRIAGSLKERASWTSTLRSGLRFAVAASLRRGGDEPGSFLEEFEGARAKLRQARLPRGEPYEIAATLVLRELAPERRAEGGQVERMAEIWAGMKSDHPWLTGADDLPACALLTASDDPAHLMRARIEDLYEGLRAARFSASNPLQTASHVLFFHSEDNERARRDLFSLWDEFRGRGLRMVNADLPHVAMLALIDRPAAEIADTVERHRAQIGELRPRPSRQTSFVLAVGTAFLEHVEGDGRHDLLRIGHVRPLLDLLALIQAQAATVAASGGMVATTS